MVDAIDSKSIDRKVMRVQVSPAALLRPDLCRGFAVHSTIIDKICIFCYNIKRVKILHILQKEGD